MLKAVRFDEKKHKDIINFFSNFKDKNNKLNESEGIRYLMELGYAELTTPQPIYNDPPDQIIEDHNPFNMLDIEDLKEELRKQILEELQINIPQPIEKPSINMEDLKKELLNEVMNQVNTKTFDNLNSLIDKLGTLQPVYMQQPTINPEPSRAFTEINTLEQPTTTKEPKQTIDIPADTNPLLANLLANANR